MTTTIAILIALLLLPVLVLLWATESKPQRACRMRGYGLTQQAIADRLGAREQRLTAIYAAAADLATARRSRTQSGIHIATPTVNILSTPCPQQWRAACAAARAAGQPEPSWFSWVTAAHARPVQTALSDDIDSLTNGDGSLWQV